MISLLVTFGAMMLLWWKRTTMILNNGIPSPPGGFFDMLVSRPSPYNTGDLVRQIRSADYKNMGFTERYTLHQQLILSVIEPGMSEGQTAKTKSLLTESLMGLGKYAPPL